jgi:DNA segregation ATPase FtsK/SpoIIIE, S-DNA-T family
MKFIARIFNPTKNRRLNELLGLLLCVSALLIFLALVSYSPLDPSLDSASALTGSRVARNWIGLVGAYVSDLLLQFLGIGAFLLPAFALGLGVRWFRSRQAVSPVARLVGGIWLLMFVPALVALLPRHMRWQGLPVEGYLGRILGDALIHYLNVAGAYIVATSMLAVALYFCTAFSFAEARLWAATRFSFVKALSDRWKDRREARARKKLQKELERRRAAKPAAPAQTPPAPVAPSRAQDARPEPERPTGIERFREEQEQVAHRPPVPEISPRVSARTAPEETVEVAERPDKAVKGKTTLTRVSGAYKLPPTSLLHRPDEQHAVDSSELKLLAQVLTSKYAEFDVHGQVTQIKVTCGRAAGRTVAPAAPTS